MKKIIICLSIFLSLTSCDRREPNQLERGIVESIKKANNSRSYNQIKPFLSNEFHFTGSDISSSFTSLYSYLNFSLSEKILKIEINYVKEISDSLFKLNGTKFYEKYDSDKLELVYKLTDEGAKIVTINSIKPHRFSLTTRASYKTEEIFGNNPVDNIINLQVLDKSSADSVSDYGYTIFYNKQLKANSRNALILFKRLDSLLVDGFEMSDVEKENLFLTDIETNNTITIGKDRNIPWTMALYETDSINTIKLTDKIGTTYSHEIIEGTLVHTYNLEGYEYRWFRDGLSDYLAFRYCSIVAPEEAERYFIDNRLSSAEEFAGNGNLLDWRGNGPIETVDKGKLYGKRFIYYNEVGQYGRAFKFFKDLFQGNEDDLVVILKKIKEEQNISVEKVLNIMSKKTNKNIRQMISEY